MNLKRRFPLGVEVHTEGVHFRIWAPECNSLHVLLNEKDIFAMDKEEKGYFSKLIDTARAGMRYKYLLNEKMTLPDPLSRFQPEGPHGASEIIDSRAFKWCDQEWKGVKNHGNTIYEMHVGTFTKEGTWSAAQEKLSYLKDLGITIIEMMPVAEFEGHFGWGYDGVDFFAPYHIYGKPDDLKSFINKAHSLNLGVIIDVVYNHFGPEGNYLFHYAKDFVNEKTVSEWGNAINFDGKNSSLVREFFITNAKYWIEEYHFDGLRLDAVHSIFDHSENHIIKEITQEARNSASNKSIFISLENEAQKNIYLTSHNEGGYECDSAWNDDFHHSAHVLLTGLREAYYTDYYGSLQEILSALKYGYLYQGQYYSWQKKCRGSPSLHNDYGKYTLYLQNHDQIANSSTSFRIHKLSDPAFLRMMTLILLLSPQNILLFQGQEFGTSSPFHYFADLKDPLARNVWEGRKQFLMQFDSFNNTTIKNQVYADPCHPQTYLECKLQWSELNDSKLFTFHKNLLQLRNEDPVFTHGSLDGSVIENALLLLRYFGKDKDNDRLILCNFGNNKDLKSLPEPLFAPPLNKTWKPIFSTQDFAYGGVGTPEHLDSIQGHTGMVFKAI